LVRQHIAEYQVDTNKKVIFSPVKNIQLLRPVNKFMSAQELSEYSQRMASTSRATCIWHFHL